ncbi:unnamed protein product [Ceratitis capitata]|uniref:(Mediterranean fruit fly) hypothetical protein n=1 Tax=Ceratitis capitata TaxID=7213 RepID=A0A811UAC9_CERCA|nr:unnamed protein product [Ceratitis capitata]
MCRREIWQTRNCQDAPILKQCRAATACCRAVAGAGPYTNGGAPKLWQKKIKSITKISNNLAIILEVRGGLVVGLDRGVEDQPEWEALYSPGNVELNNLTQNKKRPTPFTNLNSNLQM